MATGVRGRRAQIPDVTLKSGEVRYRFVTDALREADGKRRQVTHTFDTMRGAGRAGEDQDRIQHRAIGPPDKMTLDEYLSEWLAAIGRGVEPGARAYQDALRVPRELLGHRKLQSINTADVNAVVDFMLTKGRKKGGPVGAGLGPRSVQMMLTVLRRAFQKAVRDRKMAWNRAEGVRSPRQRPARSHRGPTMRSGPSWTPPAAIVSTQYGGCPCWPCAPRKWPAFAGIRWT